MRRSAARAVLVAGAMVCVMAAPEPAGGAREEVLEIDVTAARFEFTPDTITVPRGARVRLAVQSADGIHGFQIRQLGINRVVPRRGGGSAVVEFTAERPGRFEIACSEYCGNGHDEMRGTLIVEHDNASGDGS